MKILFSEAPADYSRYVFPYAVYGLQETETEIPQIYARGFLPYTDTRFPLPEAPFYYLARSIRVDLKDFSLTSENRRIRRKMDALNPLMQSYERVRFPAGDDFWAFCRQYARERIGDAMPAGRLDYIFGHRLLNRIFVFENGAETLGYVWAVDRGEMLHYWFAFYNTDYMRHGLGKWMMEQVISQAAAEGKRYVYLGTCYGSKAMYKVRDFRAVQYFDGNQWKQVDAHFKTKCKENYSDTLDDWKRFPERYLL